jgi:YVTN family beta-propeller protein
VRGALPDSEQPLARQLRHPVALACVDGGKTLLVANRRSGTVSIVDTTARRVVAERALGRALSDLAMLPDGRHLLVTDQAADELLLLQYRDRTIDCVRRVGVSSDPVRVVVSSDGTFGVVAARWSRRVDLLGLAKQTSNDLHPAVLKRSALELPFCPHGLALLADGSKLVVADAFGGRLAVVDTARCTIESVRALPGHNIRGLALARDGRTLLLAHQVARRLAQSSFDDVHWGLFIRNHLRVLRTDTGFKPGTDAALLDGSRLFDLGDVGYAAGDPGAIALGSQGHMIVALQGVDEVAISSSPDQAPRRTVVGRHPTALAPSPDGSVVYVAGTLDDTISVVDIKNGQRLALISLGPRPELTPSDRGEQLFYSARLSHDGWMSCQSCHSNGHTNNLVSDTLGDGSFGAPKRVPSLLGVAATGPWTWTGSMTRLDEQVHKSILTTMHGTKPTDGQVADLTAFLRSLAPPPTIEAIGGDSFAVARGRRVFDEKQCATCHVPPQYTAPKNYDVGLVDEVGNREFNPPSLRGVSQRDALLHDGRARSLGDVFRKERHPRGLVLSPGEVDDLVAFLRTL